MHLAGTLRLRLAEIETDAQAQFRAEMVHDFANRFSNQWGTPSPIAQPAAGNLSLAWAPVAVSLVVTGGFFATLIFLIALIRSPDASSSANQSVIQIVNITVGALTAAFATVVSFWLGSSEGSRLKDRTALQRVSTNVLPPAHVAPLQSHAPTTAPNPKDARQFSLCLAQVRKLSLAFPGTCLDGAAATDRDPAETAARLRITYWNGLNCDALAPGVDLMMFDIGVTSGVATAARMLQRIVHVEPDGQIGTVTIGAAQNFRADHLIAGLCKARLAQGRHAPERPAPHNAQMRRAEKCRTLALAMI
ncbi:hypothetical protein BV911_12305 [Pseudoruegeria sp. SK021]|nr:hypothetical protein BV911_12305 [Pseudoruegeria sp. SK021]